MNSVFFIEGVMNNYMYEKQENGLLIVILFRLRDYKCYLFFYLIFPNLF